MRGLLLFLFCLLLTAARADCPPNANIADWVFGGKLCQAAATFGAEAAGASPVLIVVVHGDISDGGSATYHVAFAKTLARPGVVVGRADAGPAIPTIAAAPAQASTLSAGADNYTRRRTSRRVARRDRGAAQTHYRAAPCHLCRATPAARRSAAC